MTRNLLFRLSSVVGLALYAVTAQGQKSCGFDVFHQEQLRSDPKFRSRLEAFEKVWDKKQDLLMNTAARVVVTGTDTTYEIPVVFHIIHTGSAIGTNFNPTDGHIQDVVTYLNQVYAATWPGYASTTTGGTNIPLRFVLAKRDPLCNATTGINRINGVTTLGGALGTTYDTYGVARTTANGISDAQLKSIIQWNPADYYNIWVVNKIDGWSGYVAGSGVVGYAQFAGGAPATDGTVIMEAFNAPDEVTLPHELGHAFNLYHTFQGGCVAAADCATNGDRVCDTDPHDQVSGCPTGINPCTSTSWLPVTYNIMNYTDCTDRFSEGQNARIKAAVFFDRGSLVQSLGGTVPGGQATYALPVALTGCVTPGIDSAGNSYDIGPTYVQIGDMQSFTGGYNGDGNMAYVDHTVPTCGQAAVAPANMNAGQTYTISVGTGLNPENVRVYIDFDNNGTFDTPTETVFSSDGGGADQFRVHTGSTIIIPSIGVVMNTPLRMRVLSDFYGNSNPVPCGSNLQYGQAEDFTVIITNNPLPIFISKIEAKAAANHRSIDIQWNAEQENDASHYEIERSLDGKSFEKIGRQQAKGNHSEYVFNDAAPGMDQLNFYRLKMVDKDESFMYSKVVSAAISDVDNMNIGLYPNPARDVIHITSPVKGIFDLVIKNEVGQTVYTQQGIEMKPKVPLQIVTKGLGFTAGIYYLQLTTGSGVTYDSKFVKQ